MKDIELALKEAGFLVVNDEKIQQIIFTDLNGNDKYIKYYEFFDLTILLGSYEKAVVALKNGVNLSDFMNPQYTGLPIEWVFNLLVNKTDI